MPRIRTVAAFLGLTLGAILPLAAQRTIPDVPCVTGGVERQRLDLYLPADASVRQAWKARYACYPARFTGHRRPVDQPEV